MYASFKKLNDGTWGVRVPPSVPGGLGAKIQVRKADGSTTDAVIRRVLFTAADGTRICSIEASASSSKSSGGSSRSYGYSRSRGCKTGGNCSSFGSGKSCGASDCDGY